MLIEQGRTEQGERRYPVKVRRMRFASQAAQVFWLRQMVNRYRTNQLIREKAVSIIREAGCPPKGRLCQMVAIARWVQVHVDYVNEPEETFQSPIRTLTWRAGDCDDHAALVATLIESIAIPSKLAALEWRGQYRHIYPQGILMLGRGQPPRTIHLDTTLKTDVRKLTNPIAIAIKRGDNPRVLAL